MYGGPHSLLFTYNSPIVKKPHLALQQTFRRSTCKTISRVRVIPARCLRVSNRDLSLKYPSLLTRDGGYLPKRQTGTSAVREAALTSALADSSLEVVVNVSLDGTGKCSNSTTLPFLDHMLDQLGTHGLLDVSVEVRGRTQDIADEQVNGAVGNALGQVFADLGLSEHHVTSTFSAPLDESLVGATVSLDGPSQLTYDVGFPTTLVGTYETRLPELFFQKFIQASGMSVSLVRQTPNNRGNSHHIIEATFKAFARALRAAIDEVDQRSVEGTLVKREATIHRKTGETDVNVAIMLDGKGSSDCDTMIPHLDLMLKELAETSGISFKVECEGDIHIDDHHSNEDIAIVIGKALQEALGNRSGINRMGFASATVGGAQVEVTLDLSGRPHLEYELEIPDERVGTYDTQLVEHFYQSIVNNSGTTLHVRGISGTNSQDLIMAGIHAFGAALKMAVRFDDRRLGKIASSKGVL